VLVAGVAAMMSVGVLAGPAHADVTVSAEGKTFFLMCPNIPLSVTASYPEATDFSVSWRIYSPTGALVVDTYGEGSVNGGTAERKLSVCGTSGIGLYTVQADALFYNDSGVLATETGEASFQMTGRTSRTFLRVSDLTPKYRSIVRFVSTSQAETRKDGWQPTYSQRVFLELRCGDSPWHRLRGSRGYADREGHVVWRYIINTRATCAVRALTFEERGIAESRSKARWINPWGRVIGRAPLRGSGASLQ
jgi:hypothetical protein